MSRSKSRSKSRSSSRSGSRSKSPFPPKLTSAQRKGKVRSRTLTQKFIDQLQNPNARADRFEELYNYLKSHDRNSTTKANNTVDKIFKGVPQQDFLQKYKKLYPVASTEQRTKVTSMLDIIKDYYDKRQ